MRRLAFALAATALVTACRSTPQTTPSPPPVVSEEVPTAVRIKVATAEARRGAGIAELVDLVRRGDLPTRLLALRGLGRVGGTRARSTLVEALRDRETVAAAASALGVMASLFEQEEAIAAPLGAALLAAHKAFPRERAVVEALGRVGTSFTQPALGALLTAPETREMRETAVLALARHGRRNIPYAPAIRLTLIGLLDDPDANVRYAAVYAFAREHIASEPPPAPPLPVQNVGPALAKIVSGDGEARIRALGAAALAKQRSVGAGHAALQQALRDNEWRVAVEAVRALAGDSGDDVGRDAVAVMLSERFEVLATKPDRATEAHVVIEALRVLGPHAKRPLVDHALAKVANRAASASIDPDVRHWVTCLTAAAQARTVESPDLGGILGCGLQEHLAAPLVADLITAGVGDITTRWAAAQTLARSKDPRTRAAGLSAMGALTKALTQDPQNAELRSVAAGVMIEAIESTDPIIAGAALESATGLSVAAADRAKIDSAIIARALRERDPELAVSALGLIQKAKLARGRDACRAHLAGMPLLAAAARACLRDLGESIPLPDEPPAAVMPALRLVIERGITWELTVEHDGAEHTLDVALDPFTAPWAVASIIQLTDKGTYNGLAFHRVVPDFVIQGGDPSESGWGGVGYTLPAEPTAEACFVEGGVGLADAGPDSAGSQWFVMHSRAPHLDARYTCIGRTSDAGPILGLQIGDKVIRARIRRVSQ